MMERMLLPVRETWNFLWGKLGDIYLIARTHVFTKYVIFSKLIYSGD